MNAQEGSAEQLIRASVGVLLSPGHVVELRAVGVKQPGGRRATESGYFNSVEPLVASAARIDRQGAKAVYLTLNPVDPRLLSRRNNRSEVIWNKTPTTSDQEIIRRHLLLIDCDPVRPADISSTDQEHIKALARANTIEAYLRDEGWPEAVKADSGNGMHLAYRIDLPNDAPSAALIKRVLAALDSRFSDEAVGIDQTVFNASRIVKLWGTWARKGDSTVERPHRQSRLLSVSQSLEVVTREQLERIAALAPEEQAHGSFTNGRPFDVADYLGDHNLEVSKHGSWNNGQRWELETCPWDSSHKGSAFVVQLQSGAIGAGCLHNSCRKKRWQDLRDALEGPGWRSDRGRTPPPQDNRGDAHVSGSAPESPNGAQRGASASGVSPGHVSVRLTLEDAQRPPVERFILGPMLPLEKPSVIFGPTSIGKSAAIAQIAFHLAAGSESLWGLPLLPGGAPVLVYSAEDTLDDWKRKSAAIRHAGGIDIERALDRLHIIDKSEGVARLSEMLTVRTEGATKLEAVSRRIARPTEEQDLIIAEARHVEARLILVETASRLVDDEDNPSFAGLMAALGRIARETGAAVPLSHHATKAAAKDNDSGIENARGGGALVANARNVLSLFPADEEQAKPYRDRFPTEDIAVLVHGKSTSSTRRHASIVLGRCDTPHGAVFRLPDEVAHTPEEDASHNRRMEEERARELEQLGRLFDVAAELSKLGPVSQRRLRDRVKDIGVTRQKLESLVLVAIEKGVLRAAPWRGGTGTALELGKDPRTPIYGAEPGDWRQQAKEAEEARYQRERAVGREYDRGWDEILGQK
jgi:hypothetical protein